jgi:hypothetical protein
MACPSHPPRLDYSVSYYPIKTGMLYSCFFLQEKKKELQAIYEEEERRIRMKSVGNIR